MDKFPFLSIYYSYVYYFICIFFSVFHKNYLALLNKINLAPIYHIKYELVKDTEHGYRLYKERRTEHHSYKVLY